MKARSTKPRVPAINVRYAPSYTGTSVPQTEGQKLLTHLGRSPTVTEDQKLPFDLKYGLSQGDKIRL